MLGGLRNKFTAEELRGGQEPVVMIPNRPVRSRAKSQAVADAEVHEQWLEEKVQTLQDDNAKLVGQHTREMAEIRAQMSTFEESNKILHEQIANMEASHAVAIVNMQARLDEANEAVVAVGTLVTTSAEVLTKCLRYLPANLRKIEPGAKAIAEKFVAANAEKAEQSQEG